ncbi:hypothetical protein [Nocardia sp. NPDC005998]|uniref:hypothetical protein n=1 Tax=Nocardia sp. NPDC005998 TaxID=3156894 RepID=UPI00339F02B7
MNTARSSTGAVPPPWRRGSNCGNKGSTKTHSSSGTNHRDNSSTTARHNAASAAAYILSTHPVALGTTQVLAVMIGHILGVGAAHDRRRKRTGYLVNRL